MDSSYSAKLEESKTEAKTLKNALATEVRSGSLRLADRSKHIGSGHS